MPFKSLFKSNATPPVKEKWTNCCRAPDGMKIEPPLPKEYTAWIHRAGWILYVHEPTQQGSWMHPVKLAQLEARGLKGPGKVGPEMFIWEKNVNVGGHYVIDYGYPPKGRIVASTRPTPGDFNEIDEIGWDAWDAKRKAEIEDRKQRASLVIERDPADLEKLREFLKVQRRVKEEQGLRSSYRVGDDEDDDGVIALDQTDQEVDHKAESLGNESNGL